MKRKILTEVFSQTPEMALYHYTTQKGLLGIVQKKEIWATHTQYLNDKNEYLHALQLVREEIQRKMSEATQRRHAAIFQDMLNGLDGKERINVCVASFSLDRDSLSQWRAYGSPTAGFAVGIPGPHIKALVLRRQFYLAQCLYDPDKQRELIAALVAEVFEENCERQDKLPEEHDDLPPGGNLDAYLNRYAPILKSHKFAEEQEWRIISRPLASSSERFEFREGRSMIIPYYRFPLHDGDIKFQLQEVVVGPTPNSAQSVRSASNFLVSQQLWDCAVNISGVPYRNW
ncbi:MAG TPA: DUF2971 domain-containing protein [Candidatus Saccharimonadales bacterium]|jgi:hypothetical protein|nr:DUF2971 domain-containing protein [Candidatus Saccharimonadales bacterium]